MPGPGTDGRRGGRAAGRPVREPTRDQPVARDRKAAAADRDERIYARKRANQQRQRARQDRSSFDPSPPEDDDWTIAANDSDGLVRITPPTAVGETLQRLVQRRGWDERLRGATAASRWVEIVGEQLADRCEPVRLVHGTLTVRAENQVWATQLRYMLPHLRASAEVILGPGTVKEVTLVVGKLQGHGDVLAGSDRPDPQPPVDRPEGGHR
jgi:predicted nucleic acid-binding Zn ribbon protein